MAQNRKIEKKTVKYNKNINKNQSLIKLSSDIECLAIMPYRFLHDNV